MRKKYRIMADSIQNLYKTIVLKLKAIYADEEARAMADRLFVHYFHLTPTQKVMAGNTIADETRLTLIEESVSKLLSHVPLQYVLGSAFFMDLELLVTSSVLIPRPETEELVSLILKHYSGRKTGKGLKILDIGTGSGCIAIALNRYLPESHVSAIDISEEAIKVAAANAEKNHATVNFIHADILDHAQWDTFPKFDIIVSNPPYVTNAEKVQMQLNVLDHEPHTALFVPDDDPLLFYREIIMLAKKKLCERGSLWFEINEMFGVELKKLAESKGFKDVNIFFDIRGKSRFLHAIK